MNDLRWETISAVAYLLHPPGYRHPILRDNAALNAAARSGSSFAGRARSTFEADSQRSHAQGVVGADTMQRQNLATRRSRKAFPTPTPSGPHCHIMCEFGSAVWKRSADKTIAVSLPVFFHQWDTRWFSAIASPALWTNGS